MSLGKSGKRMFAAGVVVCVTAGALVVGCMNKNGTKWLESTEFQPISSPWVARSAW